MIKELESRFLRNRNHLSTRGKESEMAAEARVTHEGGEKKEGKEAKQASERNELNDGIFVIRLTSIPPTIQ